VNLSGWVLPWISLLEMVLRDKEKEYLMKEFRAMIGRHYSGQSYGLRQNFPGPSAIR